MIGLLLLLVLLLQVSLTTLPLLVLFFLWLTIKKREGWVIVLAFFAGLFSDTLLLRPLGLTSLFLIGYVFLILLYQRKYEIQTLHFIAFASFFGSFFYLFLFGFSASIPQSLAAMLLSVVVFVARKHILKRRKKVVSY